MESSDTITSNNVEYVELFKTYVGQNKLPNEFDSWTVNTQCNWIKQNASEFFPNVPQSLHNLIPGFFCELDNNPSLVIPKWMDMDKYRRGQEFVQKNKFAVFMAKFCVLMHVRTFLDVAKPVILGGRSHTPFLNFKRYRSTLNRILNWYKGEPWVKGTKAYEDMQVTRRMHTAVRNKVSQMTREELDAACTFANPWCPDRELLMKDFAVSCPFGKVGSPYTVITELAKPNRPIDFNNADMAGIQGVIISPFLLHPKHFGIHDANDENLEAFCHMWRCYGYFLGIKDEYNFCRGNLEEIKQRTQDLFQYWVKPAYTDFTPELEHIGRCLTESLTYYSLLLYIPFKVYLLIITDAINIKMIHLRASLNYIDWIFYQFWTFLLHHVLQVPIMRIVFNMCAEKIFENALNYRPEKLAKLREKSEKKVPNFFIK